MNRGYSPDPLEQFREWFEEGMSDRVALATATRHGAPSVRMVLLKGVDERGFIFYTNYESRKGRELAENANAALAFYWPELERQVRASGTVSKLSREESDKYFQSRPRGHQLGAWVSTQSDVIANRGVLEE